MRILSRVVVVCLLICDLLLPAFSSAASKPSQKHLYLYNWRMYLPDAVIKAFEKETGIKVVYATYESNEEMYDKVKRVKSSKYDLVVPSTYFVSKMSRENLLQKIDREKIPNLKNIDPARMSLPFDPRNEYSVPYLWGSTGLLVNTSIIPPGKVQSWEDLWNPAFKGQILLKDDLREVFHVGLRVLGYSGNTRNPEDIRKAYEKLMTLMPSVKYIDSESMKTHYVMDKVSVGMIEGGEAYQLKKAKEEFVYIYPREGAIMWMDSFVIPKSAVNVGHAYTFIDFVLRPENAKLISETLGYATPNREALKLLDKTMRENKIVYPDPKDVANGEYQLDVEDALKVYEQFWTKLKAMKRN